MFTIRKNQTELIDPQSLLAEASTIGLAPGEWPDFISVLDENNAGFLFQKGRIEEGQTTYHTRQGRFNLVVLND